MRRKMLGAILLPIPFAALPVLVVLAGALFGSKGADSAVVTTKDRTPALEERVSTASITTSDESTLARVSTQAQDPAGCGDDLSADF